MFQKIRIAIGYGLIAIRKAQQYFIEPAAIEITRREAEVYYRPSGQAAALIENG